MIDKLLIWLGLKGEPRPKPKHPRKTTDYTLTKAMEKLKEDGGHKDLKVQVGYFSYLSTGSAFGPTGYRPEIIGYHMDKISVELKVCIDNEDRFISHELWDSLYYASLRLKFNYPRSKEV